MCSVSSMLAVYLSLAMAKKRSNFCLVGGGYTAAWSHFLLPIALQMLPTLGHRLSGHRYFPSI